MTGGKLALLSASVALAACAQGPAKLSIRPVGDAAAKLARSNDELAAARGQLALNDVGLALEAFRNIAVARPSDPAPLVGIADCYAAMGRFDLAETNYEAALSLAPNDGTLLLGLARILDLEGQPDRAAEVRREAQSTIRATPAVTEDVHASGIGTVTVSLPPPHAPIATAAAGAGEAQAPRLSPTITVSLPPVQPAPRAPAATIKARDLAIELLPAPPVPSPIRDARPLPIAIDSPQAHRPRLERLSPGEVALVTNGQPIWTAPGGTRVAEAAKVQWIPLQPSSTVQVLNGARSQGLAATVRMVLLQRGWRRISVGTSTAIEEKSFILYPQHRAALARRLAAQFGVRTRLVHSGGIVLVLGRDIASSLRAQRQL
jgi:tetratricopeptide (TPR) repeat protein